jgi:FkbM family methyltransferase
MFKAIARALVPRRLRMWLQRRKLEREMAAFPRRVVEHRYGDVTLKIELADGLAAGWYDHDWGALPEVDLLGRNRLRPGARVFDIGAHQGVVGLILAHRVGPAGQVVLVEPNGHNVAVCARNIELNQMPWVTPRQAAISDTEGTIRFTRGLNGQAGDLSDYAGLVEVPAVTVDTLTAEYGVPDVVFIDVEGYECRALAGAAKTFAAKPDWFVEAHVGHGLEAAGWSVDKLLGFFPPATYDRFVHSEGDLTPLSLASAPAEKTRSRFFLTAIRRRDT